LQGWRVEGTGCGGGTVHYDGPPRFAARWLSGGELDALAAIEGACWSDAGSGEADAIHLYGFTWSGPLPSQAEFDRLMARAARAIDAWIAARL